MNKPKPKNNILAIDPGANSGIAVVSAGPPIKLVAYYHLRFARKNAQTPSEIVRRVVEKYTPRFAIIEDQFLYRGPKQNPNSFKSLVRKSGRWEEACKVAGLEVKWVNPQTWQSRIFKGVGRKREQLEDAYLALAKTETRVLDLPVDVAAAYCLGRYGAVQFRQLF